MLPIRDHNPSGKVPYVTYGLMIANIGIFLTYGFQLGDERLVYGIYNSYALVPIRVTNGFGFEGLITSQFLHAGWMHLAGNMLFLFIYGDNIEEECGHFRFLLFYLASGVAAGLAQIAADPYTNVPMVGASGAIAGVMGGYLLLFPKAKVDIFFFFVVFFRIIPLPAWVVLAFWFIMQFLGGLGSMQQDGGVAYWAHAGGFIAGLVLLLPLWLRRGSVAYWERTEGHPPHPPANYDAIESRLPKVKRR